ncbi:MAG: GFA family protein [Nannocystaceae bacterium]
MSKPTVETFHGSCHCGAVRFEVDLDLAAGTGKCNCTFCTKTRHWGMIVKPEALRVSAGEEALRDYQHGYRCMHLTFCGTCGVRPFARGHLDVLGGDLCSINLACLDDLDPARLAEAPVTYYDGRHDRWDQAPAETRHL